MRRSGLRHFTVRRAGDSWRVSIPHDFETKLRNDGFVQALLTKRFNYSDDAGAAGQAVFRNATYDVY